MALLQFLGSVVAGIAWYDNVVALEFECKFNKAPVATPKAAKHEEMF